MGLGVHSPLPEAGVLGVLKDGARRVLCHLGIPDGGHPCETWAARGGQGGGVHDLWGHGHRCPGAFPDGSWGLHLQRVPDAGLRIGAHLPRFPPPSTSSARTSPGKDPGSPACPCCQLREKWQSVSWGCLRGRVSVLPS